MADAKKAAIDLLVLGAKPKGRRAEADEAEDTEPEAEATAGDDMLDAIRSRDPAALLDAVRRVVHECMAEGDEGDELED